MNETTTSFINPELFRDLLVLICFCFAFEFGKSFYFFGETPYQGSLLSGITINSVFGSIFCFPAIFIGIHVKKSSKWFFSLAWLTWVLDVAWSHYAGSNLSYKVGDIAARINGEFTFFGFVYQEILSTTFFLALYSTFFAMQYYLHRKDKKIY